MVYQQKYDELEENYESVRAEYDKVAENSEWQRNRKNSLKDL